MRDMDHPKPIKVGRCEDGNLYSVPGLSGVYTGRELIQLLGYVPEEEKELAALPR